MGLFDLLFGKKSTKTTESTHTESTPSKPIKDLNPKGKDLEWFQSEYGIESLKEYTAPKAYLLDERLKKEYENKDFNGRDVSYEVFLGVWHKDAKIPTIYFSNFVSAIYDEYNIEALKYVGSCDMLTSVLSVLAQTYELDDDGEPVEKKSALTTEDLVSFVNNPVLKFVKEFHIFDLADDDTGSWRDKFNLYSAVLIFLGLCSFDDKNVLEDNKWLLEEEPYFNSLGVVKKEKGFIKYCIEHCTYPDYWKKELDKLLKDE